MTTFKTGNPVGSTKPKDLYDNAENLDYFVNGPQPFYPDRLNKLRLSWAGIEESYRTSEAAREAQFQNFLQGAGYQVVGQYAAGVTLTAYNQVLLYQGQAYRLTYSQQLPYTTTGNWANESSKFVLVGDASLRQELATGGAAFIGRGIQVVDNVAAIRNLVKTSASQFATVAGLGGLYRLDAGDTTSVDDGGTVLAANDGARWKLAHDGTVRADQFETLAKALSSSVGTLLFPASYSATISANTTFPAGKWYEFRPGAQLTIAGGVSATFRGRVRAGRNRIFLGGGQALGIRRVYPEWFGAVADNASDSQPGLQAAAICVEASLGSEGDRPSIDLGSGQYLLNRTWTLNPSANIGYDVFGQGVIFSGTRLVASSSFVAGPLMLVDGSTDGTQKICDFKLHDFGLVRQTQNTGAVTAGLQIGSASKELIGLKDSPIRDLYIGNFPVGLDIVNARLLNFQGVAIWNDGMTTASKCLRLRSMNRFCGDMTFRNCQFINNHQITGSEDVRLEASAGALNGSGVYNQLAGVRFDECILYPADTSFKIYVANGAYISDIWLTKCQWDGNSASMVDVEANGTNSLVRCMYLTDCFMLGGNQGANRDQILLQATGQFASVSEVMIKGCYIGQGSGRAVNAYALNGLTVADCVVFNCNNNGGPAIEIGGGTRRATITNNRQDRAEGQFTQYMVKIAADSDYVVVTGNMGLGIVSVATIQDLSPAGANKIVANNL